MDCVAGRRSPDAAQRASGALLIRGPVAESGSRLCGAALHAAPRPGHVLGIETGLQDPVQNNCVPFPLKRSLTAPAVTCYDKACSQGDGHAAARLYHASRRGGGSVGAIGGMSVYMKKSQIKKAVSEKEQSPLQTRITFPRVAQQKHPLATGENTAVSLKRGLVKAAAGDVQIAEEILHHRYATTQATGEWKWINQNKRSNYLRTLEGKNSEELAELLANMFRNDAAYGIITTSADEYTLENDILLDLDVLHEFSNAKVRTIQNSERCGNLYGFESNGLIAPDAPRHAYYADRILSLIREIKKPTVLEVGGGYGGLIREVMLQRKIRYINCDLPETLYACYFFLRKTMPSLKIGWNIDSSADVILIPTQVKDVISKADLMFNSHSFSEMEEKTVRAYMALLHKIEPKYFFHDNSNFVLFPKSERHIEILASDFPIKHSMYERVYMALSPWQGGGGRYREYLYVRKKPPYSRRKS
jgi:hypothetical protein